jgi:5-methylcytosine-specific restriction protein A
MCGRVTAKGIADHIIPLAFGGEDTDENMQWLCKEPCHRLKTEQESKRGKSGTGL